MKPAAQSALGAPRNWVGDDKGIFGEWREKLVKVG